jgi:Tol biopolymer transport system component
MMPPRQKEETMMRIRSTRLRMWSGAAVLAIAAVAVGIQAAATSGGAHRSDAWSQAELVDELNSSSPDGCPIESPDGRSFYLASSRPGTLGGNDIWVAHRRNERSPWSTPVNVGEPVNSTANDFCPTPLRGGALMFVSERPGAATCNAGPGSGDIYITRLRRKHGTSDAVHLGCVADRTGPNFAGPEFSPSLVTTRSGRWLYFSSTGYDGNMDIYVSEQCVDGTFPPPVKVTELSTPADDRMPNVSPDGLEIVFSSNRTDLAGAQGDFDVYVSHRAKVTDPWSAPTNLGPSVNTVAGETRPSLSADGERLYFGRAGDIWMSTREGDDDSHHRDGSTHAD